MEVALFLVAEDAAGEAGEIIAARDEAGDAWEVDDVGSDVEGEGKWEWFHGVCLGLELACRYVREMAEVIEVGSCRVEKSGWRRGISELVYAVV